MAEEPHLFETPNLNTDLSCPYKGLTRYILQKTPSIQKIFGGIDSERTNAIIAYAWGGDNKQSPYGVEKLTWGDLMWDDSSLILFPIEKNPAIDGCDTPNELNIAGSAYQIFRLVPTSDTTGTIIMGTNYLNQAVNIGTYNLTYTTDGSGRRILTEYLKFTGLKYSYNEPNIEPQNRLTMNAEVWIRYTDTGEFLDIQDYAYLNSPPTLTNYLCLPAHIHMIGLTGENASIPFKVSQGYPFFIAKISAVLAKSSDV